MTETDRGHAGARLLVVDDNEISAALAEEMLRTLDVRCVVACGGRQALAILGVDTDFDGILLDCEMPEMDGYATARAIRHLPGLDALPILAMTGNGRPEDLPDILGCGMNARLTKPLTMKTLAGELAAWIAPRAARAGELSPSA